uniref:7TM_GPCR_Srx domain-containing protein n=1 Tax=Meloidogyne hapla TaxID=6305 RepID=A0A1I8BFG1_MELHA
MVQPITLALIINTYLTFTIGILLNFLLYFLAKKYSTNDLKEYFRITVYHICWHLLQIISQTLGQPLFYIASDNNAYVFLHGPARWIPSVTLQHLILLVYLCTLGCSTTSMSLQFVDRYLVICK